MALASEAPGDFEGAFIMEAIMEQAELGSSFVGFEWGGEGPAWKPNAGSKYGSHPKNVAIREDTGNPYGGGS